METTFISIHDLSSDARILYASDSIVDILGYAPEEVVNKPSWDFFHPDELPLAQAKHGKGVELDKAAVLSYCRMLDKSGRWLGCEVVFTVVFDVLVGCTSIYRRGLKSQNRALEAPAVRRLFSSSPQDPRYHMLSHLSSKFTSPLKTGLHEPRAALFLNRYTRSLTIMYATNGLADLLGLSGEEMIGRSFYYCIEETCLPDAVRCLENAKLNDSIAYLRFWFRDPREDEQTSGTDQSTLLPGDESSLDDETVSRQQVRGRSSASVDSQALFTSDDPESIDTPMANSHLDPPPAESRASSGDSDPYTHEAVFDEPEHRQSSTSSVSNSGTEDERGSTQSPRLPIELEAVVSCTSDGMVVVLRRASSQSLERLARALEYPDEKGLFAAPWSKDPSLAVPQEQLDDAGQRTTARGLDSGSSIHDPAVAQAKVSAQKDFMNSIREIAVFAWAVVGINGSLADYGRGQPRGESQPATGLPVWQPEVTPHSRDPTSDGQNHTNGRTNAMDEKLNKTTTGANSGTRTSGFGFGDPGLSSGGSSATTDTAGSRDPAASERRTGGRLPYS